MTSGDISEMEVITLIWYCTTYYIIAEKPDQTSAWPPILQCIVYVEQVSSYI